MKSSWRVTAPSNIALVKYMGKKDSTVNLPAHGSLSMTLSSLCTLTEIRAEEDGKGNVWVPETPAGGLKRETLQVPRLSDRGREKVIGHMVRVRERFPLLAKTFSLAVRDPGRLVCRSANTFPEGAGIASSASSFAALTLAASWACAADGQKFVDLWNRSPEFRSQLASLSREGSGSSCRSFGGPWVKWEEDKVFPVSSDLPPLVDLLLLISRDPKAVSSSEAHGRVLTSPLWNGRVERAQARTETAEKALGAGAYGQLAEISWKELWEMHSLFHTSQPPFSYWEPETMAVLNWFSTYHGTEGFPMVTMDAGPNVHVLVQESQAELWAHRIREKFPHLTLLSDPQGAGPDLLVAP